MNSKALAFFILAVVALGIGVHSYMNEKEGADSKILNLKHTSLKGIKNLPTGLVTYFKKHNKEYVLADLVVNGSYEGIVSFDNVNTDVSLLIKPTSTLRVGDVKYEFSYPKEVKLVKFKGKIDIIENKAYVKGKAKEVALGKEINIKGEENVGLNIEFNNTYSYIYLKNATEESMTLPNFKGNIVMYVQGDTIDYKVRSKYIEFLKYYGESNITSSHILLKGEGVIKSDILMTPLS